MTTLASRLLQDDVSSLPDWSVAAALNAPDITLPVVVSWERTALGIGGIMDALGPQDGAALLDKVQALASTNAVLRWGFRALESSGLNLSFASTRAQFNELTTAGVLTAAQRDALFALSRRERYPSWAEFYNIKVDARAVGLARGAKE
jgi:hypothetical protein